MASPSSERSTLAIRVGMVSSFMPPHLGGLEVVAETLFERYKLAGCEVRWIASRAPLDARPQEDGRVRVGCWNGIEQWLGVPWPIWGPTGMQEVARLVRWADVLHVHDCLYFGSVLAVLLAHRVQKPILLSQQIGFVQYSSSLLNITERLAYHLLGRTVLQRASHVVFCSPEAEAFVTTVLNKRPMTASTILNGIDTERFKPPTLAQRVEVRRRLGLPASSWVVLFAGRLVEKKGVNLFIDVCRRMPTHHFLMVGDGPLRPVAGLGNLTWVPFVPPKQMHSVYQAADAFLLPSSGEGFPLAVLEAMVTGLPVIVSKGERFTAMLERERACLSAERTSTALCEALRQLRETPGLVDELAAKSRELVIREWGLETMAARYLTLIRDLAVTRR